ncbi:MAG TPA: hypothetical protein VJ946_02130 [Bacteroidales bacterium]|nr:hypothetical protein [Bacteroidales bacterium]
MDVQEFSEKKILKGIRNGKKSAFKTMVFSYYPVLCFHAVHQGADRKKAGSTVEALFVHIWKKRKNLLITNGIKTYLFNSLSNRLPEVDSSTPDISADPTFLSSEDIRQAWKRIQAQAAVAHTGQTPRIRRILLVMAAVFTLLLVILLVYYEFFR